MTKTQLDISRRTVLLDCRFLGLGGAGRVTELLLRGLREVQPSGRWILWGPLEVSQYQWSGARCAYIDGSPLKWWGQRYVFQMPRHDVAIYMHQIRPWRPSPSLTFLHDTISIHFGNGIARWLKRCFMKISGRLSTLVLTDSRYSAAHLANELKLPMSKIAVVELPIDEDMAARVRSLRDTLPQEKVILFVGRYAEHKNLRRLIEAFSRTHFCAEGGRLHLVGGTPNEVEKMSNLVNELGIPRIVIEGACSQERLEQLYATSSLLVMPSLEEGFGLPALEALGAGLRISVSDGGALPEVFGGYVAPFDGRSVESMAEALDRDVTGPVPLIHEHPNTQDLARALMMHLTTIMSGRRP